MSAQRATGGEALREVIAKAFHEYMKPPGQGFHSWDEGFMGPRELSDRPFYWSAADAVLAALTADGARWVSTEVLGSIELIVDASVPSTDIEQKARNLVREWITGSI